MRSMRILNTILSTLVVISAALASDLAVSANQDVPSWDQAAYVAEQIEFLGDDQFITREQAQEDIITGIRSAQTDVGLDVLNLCAQGQLSDDTEIKSRCRSIISKLGKELVLKFYASLRRHLLLSPEVQNARRFAQDLQARLQLVPATVEFQNRLPNLAAIDRNLEERNKELLGARPWMLDAQAAYSHYQLNQADPDALEDYQAMANQLIHIQDLVDDRKEARKARFALNPLEFNSLGYVEVSDISMQLITSANQEGAHALVGFEGQYYYAARWNDLVHFYTEKSYLKMSSKWLHNFPKGYKPLSYDALQHRDISEKVPGEFTLTTGDRPRLYFDTGASALDFLIPLFSNSPLLKYVDIVHVVEQLNAEQHKQKLYTNDYHFSPDLTHIEYMSLDYSEPVEIFDPIRTARTSISLD